MIKQHKKFIKRRQKLLLALLKAWGGRISNTDLQKYLFLFTKRYPQDKSYEFVPYRYGCFSFQSYADRRHLIEIGAIVNADDWQLANDNHHIAQLSDAEQENIRQFANQFRFLRGDDLIRYVYKNYPYYAINSQRAKQLMQEDAQEAIKKAKPNNEDYSFFTLGYEGKCIDSYLNCLIKNNIKLLCDVRKNPISRKYGFSQKTLSDTVTVDNLGIAYIPMPELGIISEKRQSLKNQEDYDRLFDEYEALIRAHNMSDLDKLERLMKEKKRVAITCFEANYTMCHRGRIAQALADRPSWNYPITHI